jgi:small subunit ribosomal protein S11
MFLRRSLPSALVSFRPVTAASHIAAPSKRWMSDDAPSKDAVSDTPPAKPPTTEHKPTAPPTPGAFADILGIMVPTARTAPTSAARVAPLEMPPVTVDSDLDPSSSFDFQSLASTPAQDDEYHLHIYSTKHNTHITFTRPDKGAIVSLSAGNVGFRKSHRGTYDAAYQLAAHVFKTIEEKRIKPRAVEVVLRGFGQGREAVVKALLGQEGRFLKPVVKRVTDSTRLKFGGTRSPKPRRLG